MEDFLERKGPEYLSQDFWGGGAKSGLNSEDTRELEETLALFLTGATSEVQHLKAMAVQTAATARGGDGGVGFAGGGSGSLASVERVMPPYRHKGTIASDDVNGEQGTVLQFQVNLVGTLNERLKALAHQMQHLQRTRQRYKVNPFRISSTLRLDSNRTKEQDEALQVLASIPRRTKDSRPSALSKESSKSKPSSKKQEAKQEAPAPLAAKYAYDVGSAAEMARLNAIAEKHRKELEAENKDLQAKFSRDSQQVRRLEGTVNEISLMLAQFTELLEEQSESVIDVHRQSKITTQHVHESEDQLTSALKSSASYRKMMVVLILAMSFAVILLDILTP
jgi:hypothetical protein